MSRLAISSSEFRAALAQAIRGQELSVRYQPIVDLTTGRMVAVEALVRWEHRTWGMIAPADFIPLAERSGLIAQIDLWVLRTACAQVRAWQRQFPRESPLVASVNLSAKLIDQKGLVERVQQTLAASGLDAACLRLEITETVLMKDSAPHIKTLDALRQIGVGIAIDDFGVGYSSLSYLRWLPADILKLDRSFITRLGQDDRDAVIVRGLVDIAHGLGMTIVAEGVETKQQRDAISKLGCSRGQGYYFAQALPAADVTALLEGEDLGRTIVSGDALAAELAAPSPAAGAPRILVIDDDPHLRQMTSCALELEGYEVIAAADGQVALEMLGRQAPSVILLDMMMPVMDGRSFTQAYRERPGRHAPIMVLTAAANAHALAEEIGAASYLRKPFDLKDLLYSVDRLVSAAPA